MNNLRLEYLSPADLSDNPKNWREHPSSQTNSLADIIDQVGWAGALLFNEATGRLIDGHARKKIAKDEKVPVLIGSWTEEQESLILASLDPLAAMADANSEKFSELIASLEEQSEAVEAMFKEIEERAGSFDVGEGEFPQIGDEEKTHGQMTFTLTNDQTEIVNEALKVSKGMGPFADDGNKNGLALARICEVFLGSC
ncbi:MULTISPECIES: hypothetical protein [Pirellulaceae]|nr:MULTISPECIES: hypothetical protein [Pirellulaceae]